MNFSDLRPKLEKYMDTLRASNLKIERNFVSQASVYDSMNPEPSALARVLDDFVVGEQPIAEIAFNLDFPEKDVEHQLLVGFGLLGFSDESFSFSQKVSAIVEETHDRWVTQGSNGQVSFDEIEEVSFDEIETQISSIETEKKLVIEMPQVCYDFWKHLLTLSEPVYHSNSDGSYSYTYIGQPVATLRNFIANNSPNETREAKKLWSKYFVNQDCVEYIERTAGQSGGSLVYTIFPLARFDVVVTVPPIDIIKPRVVIPQVCYDFLCHIIGLPNTEKVEEDGRMLHYIYNGLTVREEFADFIRENHPDERRVVKSLWGGQLVTKGIVKLVGRGRYEISPLEEYDIITVPRNKVARQHPRKDSRIKIKMQHTVLVIWEFLWEEARNSHSVELQEDGSLIFKLSIRKLSRIILEKHFPCTTVTIDQLQALITSALKDCMETVGGSRKSPIWKIFPIDDFEIKKRPDFSRAAIELSASLTTEVPIVISPSVELIPAETPLPVVLMDGVVDMETMIFNPVQQVVNSLEQEIERVTIAILELGAQKNYLNQLLELQKQSLELPRP